MCFADVAACCFADWMGVTTHKKIPRREGKSTGKYLIDHIIVAA